jgi:hypothetical protein
LPCLENAPRLPLVGLARVQVGTRVSDAQRLGGGSLLTEFDFGGDVNDIAATIAVAEASSVGYIGWEHKSYVPITGANTGLYNGDGSLNTDKAKAISRPFPMAIAGAITEFGTGQNTSVFSLSYKQALAATMPSVVFLGSLWYPAGFNVTVLSVPANAVSWTTLEVPAGDVDAVPNPRGWLDPTPFAYSLLTLTPNAATPGADGALVTVLVTPAA